MGFREVSVIEVREVLRAWLEGAALVVGFDFAVRQSFVRLLSEPSPGHEEDPLVELLTRLSHPVPAPIGQILASAWRAALSSVADGGSVDHARQGLLAVTVRQGAP